MGFQRPGLSLRPPPSGRSLGSPALATAARNLHPQLVAALRAVSAFSGLCVNLPGRQNGGSHTDQQWVGVNHPVQSKLVSGSIGLVESFSVVAAGGSLKNTVGPATRVLFGVKPSPPPRMQPPSRVVERICRSVTGRKLSVAWREAGLLSPCGWKGVFLALVRCDLQRCQGRCGKSVLGSPRLLMTVARPLLGFTAPNFSFSRLLGPAWAYRHTAKGLESRGEPTVTGGRPPTALPGLRERTPAFLSVIWKFDCIFVASGSGRVYNDQFQAPRATLPRIRRRHQDFILYLTSA
ncbi:hypothetical protein NN561_013231 [Cricetulus griseus]